MGGEDLEADHSRTLTEIHVLTSLREPGSSPITGKPWATTHEPKQLKMENLKSNLPIMSEVKYWGFHPAG